MDNTLMLIKTLNEESHAGLLFHTFHSQEERSSFGGSAFLEFQFCKMVPEADIGDLVAVYNIHFWQNDSLYIYIDDIDKFIEEYGGFFDYGIYNNLEHGLIDIYGINYYKPDLIEPLISKISENKTTDFEILAEWLNKAKNYNGFYILGI